MFAVEQPLRLVCRPCRGEVSYLILRLRTISAPCARPRPADRFRCFVLRQHPWQLSSFLLRRGGGRPGENADSWPPSGSSEPGAATAPTSRLRAPTIGAQTRMRHDPGHGHRGCFVPGRVSC
jgi:hypothetical protein